MERVSKLVEIFNSMKPNDKNKCIKKLITIYSNSNLNKAILMNKWLINNGVLSEEKYIL